jgi:hypothetical protein
VIKKQSQVSVKVGGMAAGSLGAIEETQNARKERRLGED